MYPKQINIEAHVKGRSMGRAAALPVVLSLLAVPASKASPAPQASAAVERPQINV
jgi:hypothetical protein